MKKIARIFLVISLVLSGQPMRAAGSNGYVAKVSDENTDGAYQRNHEAELALMKTVKARVDFYMAQNLASIRQMLGCLTGPAVTTECAERIHAVQENIRIKYPEMRRYLILQSLVQRQTTEFFFTGKVKASATSILPQIGPAPTKLPGWLSLIDNPLETIFHSIDISTAPIQVSEIHNALTSEAVRITLPSAEGEDAYTNTPENLNGFLQLFCEMRLIGDDLAKNCANIRVGVTKNGEIKLKSFIEDGFFSSVRSKLEFNALRSEDTEKLVEKQLLGKFYEVVRQFPFLALIESAKPTNSELIYAFKIMEKAAIKALERHEERWDLFEKKPGGPAFYDYLEIMDYGPVVQHTIEAFEDGFATTEMQVSGESDYNAVAAPLFKMRSRGQLLESGGHILKMLGLNIAACWFPASRFMRIGKLAKLASKLKFNPSHFKDVIRPICYSLANVPFAIYFISGSVEYYNKTYNEIFSAMVGDVGDNNRNKDGVRDGLDSGERYLQEISNLHTAQTLLLIDLVTAPMGTGALVNAIKTTRLPISAGLRERLLKMVLKRQSTPAKSALPRPE